MNAARSLSMCAASLALVTLVGFAIQTSVENYRANLKREAVDTYTRAFITCIRKAPADAKREFLAVCDREARIRAGA